MLNYQNELLYNLELPLGTTVGEVAGGSQVKEFLVVMTSDNDEQVSPFHAYKFVAALQNRPAQKNPILLRVEKRAGHGGGATLSRNLQEKADMFGFIWEMLNQEKQ